MLGKVCTGVANSNIPKGLKRSNKEVTQAGDTGPNRKGQQALKRTVSFFHVDNTGPVWHGTGIAYFLFCFVPSAPALHEEAKNPYLM